MTVKKVLEDLGCRDKELSIFFTDDQQMAVLNLQYRNKKGATDVLSFSMTERFDGEAVDVGFESTMLGDVVISVDTALRVSRELEEPFIKTVNRLLVHGILHLMGYDHEKSQMDRMEMIREEERLLALA